LAFASSRDGNAEIYLQDLARGVVERISHDPGDDVRPAWLDHDHLAWLAHRAGKAEVRVYGRTTKQTSVVPVSLGETTSSATKAATVGEGLASPGQILDFTPSPDGKRLALVVKRTTTDIFVVDAQSGARVGTFASSEQQDTPAWSPDGAWIAFSRGEPPEVWVSRSDGSDGRSIGRGWLPRWVK
jgi:Tol biopolymer transport system component